MEEESDEKVVVVAVGAEGEISKVALTWALTHVVRQGDLVTLLAVLPDLRSSSAGWRRWIWPRLSRRTPGRTEISASSTQMVLQIDGDSKARCNYSPSLVFQLFTSSCHRVHGVQVNVRIKVVGSDGPHSTNRCVVATEAKLVGAHWLVLDRNLKQERKQCLEELHCNIVVITKGSHAKVLRLNLGGPTSPSPLQFDRTIKHSNAKDGSFLGQKVAKSSSSFISKDELPEVVFHETNPLFERYCSGKLISLKEDNDDQSVDSDCTGRSSPPRVFHHIEAAGHIRRNVYEVHAKNHISDQQYAPSIQSRRECYKESTGQPPPRTTMSQSMLMQNGRSTETTRKGNAVSFAGISSPSYTKPRPSPPLCSLCRHKAPLFGKPPRRFTYQELAEATNGFSDRNFLGDDGVHRGVLFDGQLVAVKQLVVLHDYDDDPWKDDCAFHGEVESLSRAQHKNIVMLIGFCMEGRQRMLVYEYVCNGSLDQHLHGGAEPLDWHARVKIAVGAARGLRYLHEDCRVGLVHGGLRTKNILLTHDFEPMVGGFSLTKCQTKRPKIVGTRIVETFGYQAPEYVEHGAVTEKTDVYAFGVVLLEILSGRRAFDKSQPKGQQLLTEWARPVLSLALQGGPAENVDQFLDPRLNHDQALNLSSRKLHAMYSAAFMCLRIDPHTRPNMSKVLKVFDGDVFLDPVSNINSVGSRSSRMNNYSRIDTDMEIGGSLSLRFPIEFSAYALNEDGNYPPFH